MSVELHLNEHQVTALLGASLFECAEALGLYVPTSCQKQGKCKECMVEVMEGSELLSPPTPHEAHLRDRFRLSCRARIVAGSGVVRCHTMRRGELTISTKAFNLPLQHRPFSPDPCITRHDDEILLDGQPIDRRTGPIHGIAMDLGTTTVVLRLFDLESGEIVADASFENPQRFGGSDVMSRISFDSQHPSRVLQRTLAGYITHAIEQFSVEPDSIYEMVVAGNSTMRDLFFRLDVHSIGQNPYRSITELEMLAGTRTTTTLSSLPRRLRIPINPNGRIVGLPIISGHVGADAAACLLAVDMAHEDRLVAVMDIGTNTELLLGNKDRVLAASCPAGPAFEGGRISSGMPGLPGAIESVRMNDDGTFTCGVIGNVPAVGICGSGLIDLLSELLRKGWINTLGRFEHERSSIVLSPSDEGMVTFNESDINELAQAKGANVAGLHVISNSYGIRFDDIDVFYLAGGFGQHLDIASAKRIGLIPDIDDARIVQVGNAAIEGASLALLSRTKREELERLVRTVQHCRLEADPEFFNYFVDGCQFTPVRSATAHGTRSHA